MEQLTRFLSVDGNERYSQPSSSQLLPVHVDFSISWFFFLGLVVIIGVSAVLSCSGSDNKQQTSSSTTSDDGGEGSIARQKPGHIAVIMDGNRRFGRQKHGVPTKGHHDGGNKLIDFVKWCLAAEIETLTVYAFSSENWNRPQHEVNVLMQIFVRYCSRIEAESRKNGIRVRFLSTSPHKFDAHVLQRFRQVERASAHCTNMTLNVCVSYGAREELALACQTLSARVKAGEMDPGDITPADVSSALLTSDVPDPDLVVRTSGERRISNFLLFQAAYAEFVFVDKLWPALTKDDFEKILDEYSRRKRRFGK